MSTIRYMVLSAVFVAIVFSEARGATETEYFAVFLQGKKIGHAIHTRTATEDKVITSDVVKVTITRLNVPMEVAISETAIETPNGVPLGFELIQNISFMQMTISGEVKADGTVEAVTRSGTAEQRRTFGWPDGAVMSEGLRLLSEQKGLAEGTEYSVKIFSPSVLSTLEGKVRIGAKTEVDLLGRVVPLTEVTMKMNMFMAGEVVTTMYVDEDLKTLKSITPLMGMQMELVACEKEFALSENDPLELLTKSFVESPQPIEDVGSAESIRYYLSAAPNAPELKIPSTDNQKVEKGENGELIVTVSPIKAPCGGALPYDGNEADILAALKATRFVQSDDEKIIEMAKQAVGDANDAAEAARRIESFVASYVTNRSLSVGYASAVEVAASKQGDCSEFAVLTAALCRAAGIPAQVVVGIVYVDDFFGIRGFGPHAWVQAYVGGKWVGLDAAFKAADRGGHDAGHIALAVGNGNPEDFFQMIFSLGQFKIEKVEVEKSPATSS